MRLASRWSVLPHERVGVLLPEQGPVPEVALLRVQQERGTFTSHGKNLHQRVQHLGFMGWTGLNK